MPKASFTLDQVKKSGTDFPKIKLAQNEIMRIVVIEDAPTYAWTHRLQKPKFSPVTGQMMMKTIERRNGEKISVPDLDFVGAPVCFGNLDVLDEKGIDKDHCPICAKVMDYPEHFSAPERRFAVHVLKYATKPGTSQVSSPFSVETRVWVMSENRFSQVTQKIAEWGGNPTNVDLILGPCINAGFQNYEIGVGQSCEMRGSEERMTRAAETFKENNAGDLEPYCGRVKEMKWVQQDIDDVMSAWEKAAGGASRPAEVDTSGTLDSSLLDSIGTPAKAAPVADLSSLDDTVGAPAVAEAPVAEVALAPASVPAAAPAEAPAAKEDITSFDDILNGLR